LQHCLFQELKRFEDGQVIEIDNQKYFVQSRLKLTTNLLSLGIDDLKFPILIKSKFNASIAEEMRKYYSKSEPEMIASLILLKLHPGRKRYSFDTESFLLGNYTDDRKDFMH
jgi:hypothetical protein